MDIYQCDFFLRAMAAGALCGVMCPLVGVFVVARRFAFLADALGHVSLTGVAVGLVLGIAPGIPAMAVVLAAAFAAEWLRQKERFYAEAFLAVVMAGGLALGVILISKSRGFGADLAGYLFGSLLTVTVQDLYLILGLAAGGVLVILFLYRSLFALALDEEYARSAGFPVPAVNAAFMVVAAAVVAMAIRAVGVLLAGALVVVPVLIAVRVNRSFRGVTVTAALTGAVLVIGGLHLSYALDLPPGPAVVLLGIAVLAGAALVQQAMQFKSDGSKPYLGGQEVARAGGSGHPADQAVTRGDLRP
ncbi:MAG TPA: metal ABC transporter permease [Desulfotomaculum sp.]|nr:metal ABC transporter permease [Desulfotomaculum sp.]